MATIKGNPQIRFPLTYVKTEPYVVPKKSLTGANTERVDTRVLQAIYAFDPSNKPVFVGQQVELFIDGDSSATATINHGVTEGTEQLKVNKETMNAGTEA